MTLVWAFDDGNIRQMGDGGLNGQGAVSAASVDDSFKKPGLRKERERETEGRSRQKYGFENRVLFRLERLTKFR